MTGGLERPPLSPTGLLKRPTCRTEANKTLQKDIYYFIAVIFSLKIDFTYLYNNYNLFYYSSQIYPISNKQLFKYTYLMHILIQ
jgi:hypothetical protein